MILGVFILITLTGCDNSVSDDNKMCRPLPDSTKKLDSEITINYFAESNEDDGINFGIRIYNNSNQDVFVPNFLPVICHLSFYNEKLKEVSDNLFFEESNRANSFYKTNRNEFKAKKKVMEKLRFDLFNYYLTNFNENKIDPELYVWDQIDNWIHQSLFLKKGDVFEESFSLNSLEKYKGKNSVIFSYSYRQEDACIQLNYSLEDKSFLIMVPPKIDNYHIFNGKIISHKLKFEID